MIGRLKRVWAIGRDTYIRFYPNPGIGICRGNRRIALSLKRGFEQFDRNEKYGWARRK